MRKSKNRHFYHIFVSPRDAPTTITQYVAWIERQFNVCQTPRSMYPSIFNSFPVIRCLSQCVSLRKSKNLFFTTFLFFSWDAPGAITLYVVWWKENSMLTNCLAACAHLTVTVSEIEWDIGENNGRKSSFFIPPLHSTPPLWRFPSKCRHHVWYGKTSIVWLPNGEKNFEDMFIRFDVIHERDRRTDIQTDWQTDGQTPHDGNSRAYA